MRRRLESHIHNLNVIADSIAGQGHIYICTVQSNTPNPNIQHKTITTPLIQALSILTDCTSWSTYKHKAKSEPRNKTKGWPNKTIMDLTVCTTTLFATCTCHIKKYHITTDPTYVAL